MRLASCSFDGGSGGAAENGAVAVQRSSPTASMLEEFNNLT
jgi:hypothetical protein